MFKYIIRRILTLIPVFLVMSMIIFGVSQITPGNPVELKVSQNARLSEADQARITETLTKKYGLDKPLPERYVIWMKNTLTGELGETVNGQPVSNIIETPMKNTIILNIFVLVISLTISIIVGIKSAVKRGKFYDRFWQVFSLIGTSMPTFFIGLLLIFVVSISLDLLPTGGMPSVRLQGTDYLIALGRHLILPVITLTIGSLAGTVRYVRNAMVDVLNQDYIRTARSKGLSEKVVVYSHAFRNALIPVVTIVIGSIGGLFAGSSITETVFSWDGLGSKLLTSINQRDWSVVMAINLLTALIYLITNFITDISYALVDPRVKLGGEKGE
ncbi:ABC transporter permease [Carnobacteriaceae bacterium zg-ZUI240]|nr:ABC transporter permease [Carnobacteriaceae bacterium zg-ZUI240]